MILSKKKLGKIRLLLLDVDGVLTDGGIIYDDSGAQIKIFNSKDGLGIRLLTDAGIQVGIVTGRRSQALTHRCKNLGIDLLYDGITNKSAMLDRISESTGIAPAEMAFMGDDSPDIPIMRQVGISIAVADAHESVKKSAMIKTLAPGGRGAVREVCDAILAAYGLYDETTGEYSNKRSTTDTSRTDSILRKEKH